MKLNIHSVRSHKEVSFAKHLALCVKFFHFETSACPPLPIAQMEQSGDGRRVSQTLKDLALMLKLVFVLVCAQEQYQKLNTQKQFVASNFFSKERKRPS